MEQKHKPPSVPPPSKRTKKKKKQKKKYAVVTFVSLIIFHNYRPFRNWRSNNDSIKHSVYFENCCLCLINYLLCFVFQLTFLPRVRYFGFRSFFLLFLLYVIRFYCHFVWTFLLSLNINGIIIFFLFRLPILKLNCGWLLPSWTFVAASDLMTLSNCVSMIVGCVKVAWCRSRNQSGQTKRRTAEWWWINESNNRNKHNSNVSVTCHNVDEWLHCVPPSTTTTTKIQRFTQNKWKIIE